MQILKYIALCSLFLNMMIIPMKRKNEDEVNTAKQLLTNHPQEEKIADTIVAAYGYLQGKELKFSKAAFINNVIEELGNKLGKKVALATKEEDLKQAGKAIVFFNATRYISDCLPDIEAQLTIAQGTKNIVNMEGAFNKEIAEGEIVPFLRANTRNIEQILVRKMEYAISSFFLVRSSSEQKLFDIQSNKEQMNALIEVLKK